MKTLQNFKGWNLLVLSLGLPFVLLFLSFLMRSGISLHSIKFWMLFIFSELLIVYFFIQLWNIGVSLNKRLNARPEQGVTVFKIFTLLAFAIFFFAIPMVRFVKLESIVFLMDAFKILGFLFVFLSFGFIAKQISLMESAFLKSNSRSTRIFFLALLFPIGAWFMQPTLNKLFSSR